MLTVEYVMLDRSFVSIRAFRFDGFGGSFRFDCFVLPLWVLARS